MDRVDINFKVCVKCMTFNHAPYIVDAMDGFCMQNADFPYVCVVMDDASTDGEQDVIRNYLQDNFDLEDTNIVRNEETDDHIQIFARHKTNHNCYFAVYLLKYNHYSIRKSKASYLKDWEDNCKYIALCEGDDYWTDSNKLRKQIHFLDKHNEYIMCSHDFRIYVQNLHTYEEKSKYEDNQLRFQQIGENLVYTYHIDNYFKGWYTQPLSCVYRNGAYLYEIPNYKYANLFDLGFFYYVIKQGKGALYKDLMGVYRKHAGGANAGEERSVVVIRELELLYQIYEIEHDNRVFDAVDHRVIENVMNYRYHHNYRQMCQCLWACFTHVPFSNFMRIIYKIVLIYLKKTCE